MGNQEEGKHTWNPEGTFFSTNSGETTTYDPNGTYVTTDPGVTTTWDPDATTSTTETTTTTETETTIATTNVDKYILVCVEEPDAGSWGSSTSLLDSLHNPSNFHVATLALGQSRGWGGARAITNFKHQTWGDRCIRKGALGRNDAIDVSVLCCASYDVLLAISVNGPEINIVKTKNKITLTCDTNTGNISVYEGAGGTSDGYYAGSAYSCKSKFKFTGNGTKEVEVTAEWEFVWAGFNTAAPFIGSRLLRMGAALNNDVLSIIKTAKFKFVGMKVEDYIAQMNNLIGGRAQDRFDSDNNRVVRAPTGTISGAEDDLEVHVGSIVESVSKKHTGSFQSPWEF